MESNGMRQNRISKFWGSTMNLMHIKYAVEVANEGSINKAAEKLYVGQPNLSRAIKELEASLGEKRRDEPGEFERPLKQVRCRFNVRLRGRYRLIRHCRPLYQKTKK